MLWGSKFLWLEVMIYYKYCGKYFCDERKGDFIKLFYFYMFI